METCCGYGYGLPRKFNPFPHCFMDRQKIAVLRTPQDLRRSTGLIRPSLLASSFQGQDLLSRKENASLDCGRQQRASSCHQEYHLLTARGDTVSGWRFRNKNRIPFRPKPSGLSSTLGTQRARGRARVLPPHAQAACWRLLARAATTVSSSRPPAARSHRRPRRAPAPTTVR